MVRAAGTRFGLTLLLLAGGVAGAPGLEAQEGGGPFLYAPSQDDATVSVIDIGTLEVAETVDIAAMGFGPAAKPHDVVVEPDGSYWYVSLIGANAVLKLDRDNRVVARADFEVPGMMALDPGTDVLYVGRSMSAVNPPHRIGRVDRSTMEVREVDVFLPRPHALAVAPAGEPVYTASLAENRMAVVWPDDEEVELADLPAAGGETHSLVQFAVSPDGRTLVGTAELTSELLVFDITDPAAPGIRTVVDVGARPWHPVFTPDGSRVFFANKGADEVTVVRTDEWTVTARIPGAFDSPHGAAVSPDGRTWFVSSNGTHGAVGSVAAIDAATLEVVRIIPLGHNVAGLGAASGR